ASVPGRGNAQDVGGAPQRPLAPPGHSPGTSGVICLPVRRARPGGHCRTCLTLPLDSFFHFSDQQETLFLLRRRRVTNLATEKRSLPSSRGAPAANGGLRGPVGVGGFFPGPDQRQNGPELPGI